MSKTKIEKAVPVLDQYREVLTETRLKVLSNLEAAIRAQELDPFEATSKLAAILLLSRPAAINYARTMGAAELWKRAE